MDSRLFSYQSAKKSFLVNSVELEFSMEFCWKMEIQVKNVCHILHFNFCKYKKASWAHKSQGNKRQCPNWFQKFCSGDFLLKDGKVVQSLLQKNNYFYYYHQLNDEFWYLHKKTMQLKKGVWIWKSKQWFIFLLASHIFGQSVKVIGTDLVFFATSII